MNTRNGDEKTEEDVSGDKNVATSRAGKADDDGGTYVGQTASDDSIDAGETGAEARSDRGGQ